MGGVAYEDKRVIMEAIEQSDLLIFTTPTYCMAPSAPMKSFMDLTFTYWLVHKPRACMFDKRAVVIATAAGSGTKQAVKPLKRMLSYWGVSWVKCYGFDVQAMNWKGVSDDKKVQIERDMKKLAGRIGKQKAPTVSLKTKLMFCMFSAMHRAGLGSGDTEKQYWEERGWLGKERPWKK